VSITKVVVLLTRNLAKLSLHFSDFSYNFLGILQVPAIWLYYWSFTFPHRPPELFNTSQKYPSLAHRPLERSQSSHPYPPTAGWARRRWWPTGLDQQAARDPLGAHLGSIGGVGRRGRGSGEGARWWPAVVAAVGCCFGEGDSMPGNGRRCKPLRVLRRRLGRVESTGWRRSGSSLGGRQWRMGWSGRNGGGLVHTWGEWATWNRVHALAVMTRWRRRCGRSTAMASVGARDHGRTGGPLGARARRGR
jgi:hypothetical protein